MYVVVGNTGDVWRQTQKKKITTATPITIVKETREIAIKLL
jgi:hypothetical protein